MSTRTLVCSFDRCGYVAKAAQQKDVDHCMRSHVWNCHRPTATIMYQGRHVKLERDKAGKLTCPCNAYGHRNAANVRSHSDKAHNDEMHLITTDFAGGGKDQDQPSSGASRSPSPSDATSSIESSSLAQHSSRMPSRKGVVPAPRVATFNRVDARSKASGSSAPFLTKKSERRPLDLDQSRGSLKRQWDMHAIATASSPSTPDFKKPIGKPSRPQLALKKARSSVRVLHTHGLVHSSSTDSQPSRSELPSEAPRRIANTSRKAEPIIHKVGGFIIRENANPFSSDIEEEMIATGKHVVKKFPGYAAGYVPSKGPRTTAQYPISITERDPDEAVRMELAEIRARKGKAKAALKRPTQKDFDSGFPAKTARTRFTEDAAVASRSSNPTAAPYDPTIPSSRSLSPLSRPIGNSGIPFFQPKPKERADVVPAPVSRLCKSCMLPLLSGKFKNCAACRGKAREKREHATQRRVQNGFETFMAQIRAEVATRSLDKELAPDAKVIRRASVWARATEYQTEDDLFKTLERNLRTWEEDEDASELFEFYGGYAAVSKENPATPARLDAFGKRAQSLGLPIGKYQKGSTMAKRSRSSDKLTGERPFRWAQTTYYCACGGFGGAVGGMPDRYACGGAVYIAIEVADERQDLGITGENVTIRWTHAG